MRVCVKVYFEDAEIAALNEAKGIDSLSGHVRRLALARMTVAVPPLDRVREGLPTPAGARQAKLAKVTIPAPEPQAKRTVEPEPAPKGTAKAQGRASAEAKPTPTGKTCKHGEQKGVRCWQCGGPAVIEA